MESSTEPELSGLRVEVLEGGAPDAPVRYFFPRTKERIVLGRDPAVCDIVFAPQTRLQGVGNEHLAFLRSLGRYQIDLNSDNVVLVDGEPAFEGQELAPQAEVRLGNAARVRVDIVDGRPGTILPPGGRQRQVAEIARDTQRLAISLAVTGAIALAALAYAIPWLRPHGPVPDTVLAKTAQSVYWVVIRSEDGGESPSGTAWVGPGPRVFTNAHVADSFRELKRGEKLLIRAGSPPYRDHEVTGVTLHPGYKAFDKLIQSARPAFTTSARSRESLLFVPACDIAVMDVTEADRLGSPLDVADRQSLLRLERGMPVALVGFPSEGLLPTQLKKPVPLSPGGTIQRMTDFLMGPNTPEANLLIQHSIPSAGGGSGSPVVDERGRVVGLLSAANHVRIMTDAWLDDGGAQLPSILGADTPKRMPQVVHSTTRSPHAALVHYAQRADLVHDFLEGSLDERTAEYVAQWRDSLRELPNGSDVELKMEQVRVSTVMKAPVAPRIVNLTLAINPPPAGGTEAEGSLVHEFAAGHHAVIFSSPDWPHLSCSIARSDWYLGHATSIDGVAVIEFTLATPSEISCEATLDSLSRTEVDHPHTVTIRAVTWDVPPLDFEIQRAIATGQDRAWDLQFAVPDGEPELVYQEDDITLDDVEADERTGTEYATAAVTIPGSEPGIYLVFGWPDKPCNLNLAAAGSGSAWWERDESLSDYPWILHKTAASNESFDVVLFTRSKRAPVSAAIRVFRWPLRASQSDREN